MIKTLIVIIILIAVGWYLGQKISLSPSVSNKIPIIATHTTPTPTPCIGMPTELKIPKINVDSHIESVGLDSQNRMDVPKNDLDTAWYNLGPHPGQMGSAVIDGHLDTRTGAPAVFWSLEDLQQGDTISVSDTCNTTHTFTVDHTTLFDYDKVPLQEVFAAHDHARLNLITCGGTFDHGAHIYTKRVIVYAVMQ